MASTFLYVVLYFLGGFVLLYDVTRRKIELNKLDIFLIIVGWPVILVLVVYSYLKGFIDGFKEGRKRNER